MRYLYVPSDVYARMEQEWNAIRRGGEETPFVERIGTTLPDPSGVRKAGIGTIGAENPQ